MTKAHRSELLKAIKERFPEIKDRLNKEEGLLIFEIAVFTKFIQRKIDAGEKQSVIDAYEILNRFYLEGNASLVQTIRNAVSEDIDLSNTRSVERHWAFEALPEPLKAERISWFDFMGYKSEQEYSKA